MALPSAIPADRVIRPDPSSGFDLFIYTMYEKPGWQARIPGDRIRPAHPGTAVQFENTLYEVIGLEPGAGTSYTYRYGLRKWEDRFVVRKVFPYSLETERAVAADLRVRRRRYRQHEWLTYLFPVTGLLPTPLLQRWQTEWGLPMRGASLASILLFGIVSLNLTVYLFTREEVMPAWAPVVIFVTIEQIIRFFWWLGAQGPVGSFAITAVYGLWNIARGREADSSPKGRRKVAEFAAERDELRPLIDQPWDLEIRSVFRDPVLLGPEPVRIEDAVYEPVGYIQEGKGIYRRYVFRLKKADESRPARREYVRDRTPAQLARLAQYERSRDRVHACTILCGYLPAARQLELEQQYDYLAARGTQLSALVLLLAAGLQLLAMLGMRFGLAHLVAIYLAAESLYRLALVRARSQPIGSVFGWLLYPFLRF